MVLCDLYEVLGGRNWLGHDLTDIIYTLCIIGYHVVFLDCYALVSHISIPRIHE